jgi:hypothetical protein
VVARADGVRGQVVRETVRALLHLAVGAALAVADEVFALGEVIAELDATLEAPFAWGSARAACDCPGK